MEEENNINCTIITGRRPSLVELPVRVNIWIRPECQRAQFEVLKRACPTILFLESDGGRNGEEWDAIMNNREIFDNEIDWNCTVNKVLLQILQVVNFNMDGVYWKNTCYTCSIHNGISSIEDALAIRSMLATKVAMA